MRDFTQVPNDVFDARLSIYAKMAYCVLRRYAWETTSCWPSQATIAKEGSMSIRRVREALIELRDAGLISWDAHPGRPSVYRFDPGTTCRPTPAPHADPPRHEVPTKNTQGKKTQSTTSEVVDVDQDPRSYAAEVALDVWNYHTGQHCSNAWLPMIQARLDEHPEMDGLDVEAVLMHVLNNPWWSGTPSPRVLFRDAQTFDVALNDFRTQDSLRRALAGSLDG